MKDCARLFCARRPSNARRFGVWMPGRPPPVELEHLPRRAV